VETRPVAELIALGTVIIQRIPLLLLQQMGMGNPRVKFLPLAQTWNSLNDRTGVGLHPPVQA
jgi:hypothetical protein